MAIELPRDANGQIIPFDTTMMYRENGNQFHVSDFFFEARPRMWFARSGSECATVCGLEPQEAFETICERLGIKVRYL